MEQEYFVWGVPQKIQKNQFKYFGKVFVGWSKTRNGTKADYVDEQVVSSVIKQEGAVVELFAVWKDSTTYTLRFNSNGGTGTMADQPMTYDVQAVVCKPDQFDSVWDENMADYMTSGGQEIHDERDEAWVKTYGDVSSLPQ